jgi:hypothetical protein
MQEKIKFHIPKFVFKKVTSLLQRDNLLFASKIDAIALDGLQVSMYENKGLALKDFIKQQMECLVEITRGKFVYKKKSQKTPEGAIGFTYQWLKRSYEFFPELNKIYNDIQNVDLPEQDFNRVLFEKSASEFLKNWGLNGVNLDVYQTKPLLNSEYGFFLLNEYEFEEEIDTLELNQEIYITIEELYLRGIKPCDEQAFQKWKQSKEEKALPPKQEPQQPQSEVKKKRTFFT